MAEHLTTRGGSYYYQRFVPKRVAALVPQKRIRHVIGKIDAMTRADARAKAREIDLRQEAYWDALLLGDDRVAAARQQEAERYCQTFGFQNRTISDLAANADLEELVARQRAIQDVTPPGQRPAQALAEALAGVTAEEHGVISPETDQLARMTLGDLLAWYFDNDLEEAAGKPPEALKAWRTRKTTAWRFFQGAVGDGALTIGRMKRSHLMAWRAQLWRRVESKKIKAASANRAMNEVMGVLSFLEANSDVRLPSRAKLHFEDIEESAGRAPFEAEYIQRVLLPTGAMDRLNAEARRVLYVMIETGMRPSEIVNLEPEHIVLGHAVPHIKVASTLEVKKKSRSAHREVPLVGCALMAMREHPDGFPRYRHKPNKFSAVANKFLKVSGLRPTDRHTVYSFRHAFEQRRMGLGIEDRLWSDIFGHAYKRPKYGRSELEMKRAVLEKMAFIPPERV